MPEQPAALAEPRAAGASAPDRVAMVLVNGPRDSVQGPRARALFGDDTPIVYKDRGRLGSIRAVRAALNAVDSGWIYCIDLGIPAAPLAALRRRSARNVRLAFELGDPALPLMQSQRRPAWESKIAHEMDRRLPPAADKVVVRGSYLAEYFAKIAARPLPPWAWIPDGVDTEAFRPARDSGEVEALRRKHGLEGRFVVGILGSLHHSPVHDLFYGWDLAEALALIPAEAPITGVVVGDGPGRAVLEAARDRLGLGDRLKLVGRVPHGEVPAWMNTFDVALSTQTDDPIGWGRTTAKLPEYLACGTAVLCTDVGEAHRWLAESGQTLPYRGMRDNSYPPRLADRLREWSPRNLDPLRLGNRELALRLFDYRVLRPQLREFLGLSPNPR